MSSDPKGVAIITGSARGIGRAIALRLAGDGYDIGLFDLPSTEDALQGVSDEIVRTTGRRAVIVIGDVSREEDVVSLVETVVRECGGVDVMIANAGICPAGPMHDVTTGQFDRVVAINVRGVFLCYKYAAAQMIKQGRGGRMIGASSVAGFKATPGFSIYGATKFAVRGLTQGAAMEYGQYGITVNAYAPGAIDTPMLHEAVENVKATMTGSFNSPHRVLKRQGQPEDIAGLVSFMVSKVASYITGQTYTIDGGMVFT